MMHFRITITFVFFLSILNLSLLDSVEKQNAAENLFSKNVDKKSTVSRKHDDDDNGGQDDVPLGPKKKLGKADPEEKAGDKDFVWAMIGLGFGMAILVSIFVIAIVSKPSAKRRKNKVERDIDAKIAVDPCDEELETPTGSPSSFNEDISIDSQSKISKRQQSLSVDGSKKPKSQNFEEIDLN